MRMGRTILFNDVRRAFHQARQRNSAAASCRPARITRRMLLTTTAGGLIASLAGGARSVTANDRSVQIAVVGAGIAGLNATWLLRSAGLSATLYEASDHIGGRIQTAYDSVAPGVYSELGGEFIDSSHEDMLALAAAFNLSLIDTAADGEAELHAAYYADGRLHSEEELIAAFQPLAEIIDNDAAQLSDTITYDSHSEFDAVLDRTNLRDYLSRNVTEDWLFKVLEAAYVNEYGLNLEDQSTLNFVEVIGTDTSDGFQVYGESDQRFKIWGGNHQIVSGLARRVAGDIVLDHRLTALSRTAAGRTVLTFQTGSGAVRSVRADFVVLCLPFTILREVAIRVPLPAVKRRAIHELGYGANAKLILGFREPVWTVEGFSGDSYVDRPYQSGWDSARLQDTPYGAYTIYPGGSRALDLRPGTALEQARRLLPGLNQVFPGVRRQWLGTALRVYWPDDPFVKASYASYRPGQWTGIRGAEGETVGNLYFAGEHTSLDWQGFMNGGAESGRLAAEALIARLG